MDPVLTIPVLVSHSRNQSSSIWQIEDPIQFQFNILETNPVLVKPLMLTGYLGISHVSLWILLRSFHTWLKVDPSFGFHPLCLWFRHTEAF